MTSKQKRILVAGAMLIVLLMVVLIATPKNSGETEQATLSVVEGERGFISGFGTLTSIAARKSQLICSYSYENSDGVEIGSGTAYFDGARMRINATLSNDGTIFETHSINDGVSVYTWAVTPLGAYGSVMAASAATNYIAGSGSTSADEVSRAVTFSCEPWTVSEVVFAPPSEVSFSSAPSE